MDLDRRHFLRLGASAAAFCAWPRAAAASAPGKSRPVGFSLYGMKSLPVLTALDECKRIGYANVELCLLKDFPTELGQFSIAAQREVRGRLETHGLALSALLIQTDLTAADQKPAHAIIRGAAEIARNLNDRTPPVLETVTGGKAGDWDALKNRVKENMRRWAEVAAEGGVRIAVKSHFGQIINSPERLLSLYRGVNHPAFTLTYDYSHYQAEGFELEPTLRAVIPHTGFIHMKDVVVGEKPARYLLVGEGRIDYVKYFRLLRELNYTGPIVVEVSAQIHRQPGYEPIATAEKCFAFLHRSQQAAA